jgi:manganese/zinc/iron transport system permease protein
MQTFIDFISFRDPNVIYVVLGMLFINTASAVIGTFALLRKRALIGDAIAHSLLPGICFGFLLSGEKNIALLMAGAFLTGWLSTFAVDIIVSRSKVKQDAAIGIVLSTFFAVGIVLLTYIQNEASGQQAGLETFLFGQAASITKSEVLTLAMVCILILIMVLLFYRHFVMVSFDEDHASSIGLPVRFIEFLITSLTVLAIAAGIQALGVILMSALIITPAAIGRMWSHDLKTVITLAVIFSVISGFGGAYVSYSASGMPTGPWVVLILSVLVAFSVLFSKRKGIIVRFRSARSIRNKIHDENILKAIFQFHEKKEEEHLSLALSVNDLMEIRKFDTYDLIRGIRRLDRTGLIERDNNRMSLTEEGKLESKRIVRLHRLWEQYLLKKTTIDTEHVHSGAEAIEHIITPEIEKELEKELGITGVPKEDY